MKASALVENVRPITIGGQHLHLLPLNAQADLDPPKTLRVQSGRAEHERSALKGGAQWWLALILAPSGGVGANYSGLGQSESSITSEEL